MGGPAFGPPRLSGYEEKNPMIKTKTVFLAILLFLVGAGFGLAGAADGMGPRFFNIIDTEPASQANQSAQAIETSPPLTYESVMNLPLSFEPRKLKRGFAQRAEPEIIQPDHDGTIRLEMREVERIEIDLGKGKIYRGHLIVGDNLRPLPIGSTLDQLKGTFSWMPGPGFLGTYDLVFARTDEFGITRRIPIKVMIKPKFGK